MVDDTAAELDRDLGAGSRPEPVLQPAERDDLVRRIERLERMSLRQERVFRRVVDLLEAAAART